MGQNFGVFAANFAKGLGDALEVRRQEKQKRADMMAQQAAEFERQKQLETWKYQNTGGALNDYTKFLGSGKDMQGIDNKIIQRQNDLYEKTLNLSPVQQAQVGTQPPAGTSNLGTPPTTGVGGIIARPMLEPVGKTAQEQPFFARPVSNVNIQNENIPPNAPDGYYYDEQNFKGQWKLKKIPEKKEYTSTRRQDEVQWSQAQAAQIGKRINSLEQSSRSSVGVAANNNLRASRALSLLGKNMTPEKKDLIVNDLLYIMQGGVPHEQQVRQGLYKSYKEQITRFIEKISSRPEILNIDETQKELREIIMGIKEVDNKVINDNTRIIKATYKPWIEKNKEQWEEMLAGVSESIVSPNEIPTPGDQPQGQVLTATNPQTGQKIRSMDGGKTWQ